MTGDRTLEWVDDVIEQLEAVLRELRRRQAQRQNGDDNADT